MCAEGGAPLETGRSPVCPRCGSGDLRQFRTRDPVIVAFFVACAAMLLVGLAVSFAVEGVSCAAIVLCAATLLEFASPGCTGMLTGPLSREVRACRACGHRETIPRRTS